MNQSDLSLSDLYALANEISQDHWGIDYTGIIEMTNRKWTRLNGRFMAPNALPLEFEADPIIGFSAKRNAERTIDEVKGTLLHELVHWRLWSLGIPHRDTDKEFIAECLSVRAPISKGRKAQDAFKRHQSGMKYVSLDEYYRSLA
jgi:hypothetical protein